MKRAYSIVIGYAMLSALTASTPAARAQVAKGITSVLKAKPKPPIVKGTARSASAEKIDVIRMRPHGSSRDRALVPQKMRPSSQDRNLSRRASARAEPKASANPEPNLRRPPDTPTEGEAAAFLRLNSKAIATKTFDLKGSEVLSAWHRTMVGQSAHLLGIFGRQMRVSTVASFVGAGGVVKSVVARGPSATEFAVLTVDEATKAVAGHVQLAERSYLVSPSAANPTFSWVLPATTDASYDSTKHLEDARAKARALFSASECETLRQVQVSKPLTVLMGYTPKAKALSGEANFTPDVIAAFLSAALEDAFREAGARAEVRVVPKDVRVPYGESDGDPKVVLNEALQELLKGTYAADFRAERQRHRADIGILVIENKRSGCGYSVAGASAATAYAVVNWRCVFNHSIEHEIGHILGMFHERDNAKPRYAKGFKLIDGRRTHVTIMGELCAGCGRLLHFSNPNISATDSAPATLKLGVKGENDNACFLRQSLPAAVEFGESL